MSEKPESPQTDVQQGIAEMLGDAEMPEQEPTNQTVEEDTAESMEPAEEVAETDNEPSDELEEEESSGEESSELDQKVAKLEAQNQKLMEQLNALLEQQKQPQKTAEAEDSANQEIQDFLGDVDIMDLTEDKDKFNNFLNDYSKKVKQSTIEEILTKLPQVVMDYTNHQLTIKNSVDNFYKENPELEPMKKYVAKIVGDISSENPDWSLDKVMEEGAKKAYESLGITKQKAKSNPAFAKQKSTSRKASSEKDLTPMEKELEAMLRV